VRGRRSMAVLLPILKTIVLAGTFVLIHHKLPLNLLHDVLVEKAWRDHLLQTIPDEQVVRFFRERYDKWHKDQPMLIESTLRRVFLLAFSPVLRYSLAQTDNLIPYRDIINHNRSMIVNLAVSDGDARRLLGCLLTVSAEQSALSRADLPPDTRVNSHHLILDEFAEFTTQSEESLARILSLCRKYGLFLVMAHQTFSQTSERLRGVLQNIGIEVILRLGRHDAEQTASILGTVNPLEVKHTVVDPIQLDKSHPLFYSLPEQWEAWVQAITDLKKREAFVKRPNGQVAKIQTLSIPDAKVHPTLLAAITEAYLKTYFRPQTAIEQELARYRASTTPHTGEYRPKRVVQTAP
jgi:hypothetical protein